MRSGESAAGIDMERAADVTSPGTNITTARLIGTIRRRGTITSMRSTKRTNTTRITNTISVTNMIDTIGTTERISMINTTDGTSIIDEIVKEGITENLVETEAGANREGQNAKYREGKDITRPGTMVSRYSCIRAMTGLGVRYHRPLSETIGTYHHIGDTPYTLVDISRNIDYKSRSHMLYIYIY